LDSAPSLCEDFDLAGGLAGRGGAGGRADAFIRVCGVVICMDVSCSFSISCGDWSKFCDAS
jgi:hypothetical protein